MKHGNQTVDYEKLKYEVLKIQNEMRTNPKGFIHHLETHLNLFKGNVFYYPGEIGIMTNEGKAAVQEAINFLKNQQSLGTIEMDENLCKAAQDHAADTGPKGMTGHNGTDGSSMSDRVERYCEWEGGLCENIDYGNKPAIRVIMSLLIDDGVSSRGHRKNLFDADAKFAGIACGYHKTYGMLTVCDYAHGIAGKSGGNKPVTKNYNIPTNNNSHGIAGKSEGNKPVIKNYNIPSNNYDDEDDDFDYNPQFNKKGNKAFDNMFNNNMQMKNFSNDFFNQGRFADFDNQNSDPDFPEGAISSNVSVSTKVCNGKKTKVTKKIYTFPDGSTMTKESTETSMN